MLISVIYENNIYGMIKSARLEELIVSGRITKFFRSFVRVGHDKCWSDKKN